MLKHVLVPLDGSVFAEKALDQAVRLLEPNGKVTLISIADVPVMPENFMYPIPMNDMVQDMMPRVRNYLDATAAHLRENGFEVHTIAEYGDAASVIVEAAERLTVDAIIIATHGRSGLNRWLFGSVTQKVLSAATCPVMVIPMRQPLHTPAKPEAEAAH